MDKECSHQNISNRNDWLSSQDNYFAFFNLHWNIQLIILINLDMLMFPHIDCGGQPWSRTCPKSPLHRKTVIKRVSKNFSRLKLWTILNWQAPQSFIELPWWRPSHMWARRSLEGPGVRVRALLWPFSSFLVLKLFTQKWKLISFLFIRKIAYKHKCHFEDGVGERSETANLNATQISNKDMPGLLVL